MSVSDLCPWDGFAPATISVCEARLCAVIAEPANAFTSLSKTVVGLWLFPRCLRRGDPALWAIAIAALLQGPLGFSRHVAGGLFSLLAQVAIVIGDHFTLLAQPTIDFDSSGLLGSITGGIGVTF